MSLTNLIATINKRGGVAFTNRYNIIFSRVDRLMADDLNLLCTNVVFPGKQIQVDPYRTVRNEHLMPRGGYRLNEVKVTFAETNDYAIRKFFRDWINKVVDPATYRVDYESNYAADIEIIPLDQSGRNSSLFRGKLLNAFPTLIGDIEFNSMTKNEYQSFEVQIGFRDLIDYR